MIKNPILIIILLLAVEAIILYAAQRRSLAKFFDIISPIFWIYFLPMLASTFGIIDSQAPILGQITKYLLPGCLLLLLMNVDVPAMMKLGGRALAMFFIGGLGVILGSVVSFLLFRETVGNQFWGGFGALCASWTGGSANMIAVKEALSVPDAVFAPMVVVDTVIPYLWMGILIAGVRWQNIFDAWNKSDQKIIEDLHRRVTQKKAEPRRFSPVRVAVLLVIAASGSLLSLAVAGLLPGAGHFFSTYAWTIILATILGLALSFTPVRRLESFGTSRLGSYLLYFILTAIGARAALTDMSSAAILIAAGLVIVLVHAIFLLAGARLLKAPLFLVAAASQANIGGVASAPVVAAVYEPGLASVGLLLAILGNIVGTYLGMICAQLCRWLAGAA
ncbi:MAG: DUF819 family protein [Deltaproteobacteria bacterium]